MTDASDDEFIVELEERFGLEGYARWWKLLEIVAKHMDKSDRTSATYPWSKWQALLTVRRQLLGRYLVAIEQLGRIQVTSTGNLLTINIPKLLKMRDEYSKKSGQTPDNVRRKEVDTEADTETEKNKHTGADAPLSVTFGLFWEQYPRKTARATALKAWKRLNPDMATRGLIGNGLKAWVGSDQWRRGVIPHASTWLNQRRWEDEVPKPAGNGSARASPDTVGKWDGKATVLTEAQRLELEELERWDRERQERVT